MQEIERKYVLSSLPKIPRDLLIQSLPFPNVQYYREEKIIQIYVLSSETGVIRARHLTWERQNYFTLTLKGQGSHSREEQEFTISKNIFDMLYSNAVSEINKTRYCYNFMHNGFPYLMEVDVYHDPKLKGLITAEIEFDSEKDYQNFNIHDLIPDAIDVSDDHRYKNNNLAINGKPN